MKGPPSREEDGALLPSGRVAVDDDALELEGNTCNCKGATQRGHCKQLREHLNGQVLVGR